MTVKCSNFRLAARMVAIVAVTTLALAGCGSSKAPKSDGATSDGPTWVPEGQVTMVVPAGVGGGSDLLGRAVASAFESLQPGLTVTVNNFNGLPGFGKVQASEGDPNVLLPAESSIITMPLFEDVPFDQTTFTPIMKLGDDYAILTAAADSELTSCTEVIDQARTGTVSAGVTVATGVDAVVMRLVEADTGVSFKRVPFDSGSELVTGLLSGDIDVALLNPGEVIGQYQAGTLKGLCVFAPLRYGYDELKDIPTSVEQGIDVTVTQFRGILAPGGITEQEQQGWVDLARKFADSEAYDSYIADNYLQPAPAFGDDFAGYMQDMSTTLGEVIKK